MRYPYDRFLTFLVARKAEPSLVLDRYGLPGIDRLWILDCRKRIRETAPPAVVAHLDSDSDEVLAFDGFLEWAESEGIRPLWEVQREFGGRALSDELDTAFSLFINRFSRSVVGLLLLAKADSKSIADIVKERLDLGIDAPAIAMYRSLFWDVDNVPRERWPRFTNCLLTREEQHLITIGYRDKPNLATIRQILDLQPAMVTEQEALTHLIETAHQNYKTALKCPDPESGDAFRWASIMLKAISTSSTRSKFSGGDGPGENVDLSGLFSVKVTKSHHVSLAELQGQYSAPEAKKIDKS